MLSTETVARDLFSELESELKGRVPGTGLVLAYFDQQIQDAVPVNGTRRRGRRVHILKYIKLGAPSDPSPLSLDYNNNRHEATTAVNMATRVALPYFASAELLPAPLPTVAQIQDPTAQLLSPSFPPVCHVVLIGEHYVVKYGTRVSLQEGENMLFVRQSSSVPVPTVYALFYDEATAMNFIIMEYISGTFLFSLWHTLNVADKEAIASQIRRHMDELRNIPAPGYYGGIWRQPTPHWRFERRLADRLKFRRLGPHPDSTISGPQETEEQWTNALWRYLEPSVEAVNERWRKELDAFRVEYHNVLQGHKPVFTHGDLHQANLILRDDGTVVIIDWEFAGWYPTYWEYCDAIRFFNTDHKADDWSKWVNKMLDKFIPESRILDKHDTWVVCGKGDRTAGPW